MAFSREPYRLTVRADGRVRRVRSPDLDGALAALREQMEAAAATGPRQTAKALTREFAPAAQVAARAALKGPGGLRAGMDLRGDGSLEAWTGRWQRGVVAQAPGENAYDALRRACFG